jgi:hypothetical protein
MNRYHPLWMSLWRGNIGVSHVLSKDITVNYISKYGIKSEIRSFQLDEVLADLVRNASENGSIQMIINKMLNRFNVECDFYEQEAYHQILQLSIVECSHIFDIIPLSLDLTINRVLRAGIRRWCPDPNTEGLAVSSQIMVLCSKKLINIQLTGDSTKSCQISAGHASARVFDRIFGVDGLEK